MYVFNSFFTQGHRLDQFTKASADLNRCLTCIKAMCKQIADADLMLCVDYSCVDKIQFESLLEPLYQLDVV